MALTSAKKNNLIGMVNDVKAVLYHIETRWKNSTPCVPRARVFGVDGQRMQPIKPNSTSARKAYQKQKGLSIKYMIN